MKLYLTIEEGSLKSERVMWVDENTVSDHDRFGEVVEGMFDDVMKLMKEEIVVEARRLTAQRD